MIHGSKNKLIYGFIDPITNELRYIGQSSRGLAEPRAYLKPSVRKQKRYVCSWIASLYNNYGLKPGIIIIEENIETIDKLNELEAFYIDYYRFIGCKLTNLVPGGKSRIGQKHTEETKKKISEAGKRPCSEETKRKISLAKKGRKMTPENFEKLQNGKLQYQQRTFKKKEKVILIETKEERNLRLAKHLLNYRIKNGFSNQCQKLIDQNGIIYNSISEAKKLNNIPNTSMKRHLNGQRTSVKGLIFRRID